MVEKGMKLYVTGTATFSKFSVISELYGSLSLPSRITYLKLCFHLLA